MLCFAAAAAATAKPRRVYFIPQLSDRAVAERVNRALYSHAPRCLYVRVPNHNVGSPKHAPMTTTILDSSKTAISRRHRPFLLCPLVAAAATLPAWKRNVGYNRPSNNRERPGQDHGIPGSMARCGGPDILNPFPGPRWTGGRSDELFPHS